MTTQLTIEYRSIEFEIEFDYEPAEPMVMYYKDMSGHPGSPAEVSINKITHKGVDFMEFFDDDDFKILENIIYNEMTI